MNGAIKLCGMLLLGCAVLSASAEALIHAENLLFSPPKGFQVGYRVGSQ